MKNIVISWVLPTARQQGGPLAVADIQHVEIELSADGGANFSPVGQFPTDTLVAPVNDLPFGDQYQARGRVVDTADQAGNWSTNAFVLADDSPPGELAVTVVVEP